MHRKKEPRFIKAIARGHRIVGMVSAFFVLMLALTGMLLNHTDTLNLDKHYVESRVMQEWYGMSAPDALQSYPVEAAWITQLEDRLYYNEKELAGQYAPLQGAMNVGDVVWVALADGILLLDRQGNIVEELRAPQNTLPLRAIGEWHGKIVVLHEEEQLVVDEARSSWTRVSYPTPHWATATVPPAALRQAIRQHYQNKMLNAERVVRDLHNGRILGRWGALLVDAAAVAFIGMALTGVWMGLQRRNGTSPGGKKTKKSSP